MGEPIPLTWLDVWAYGQATQDLSEPWEYQALHEMSRAFVAGMQLGDDQAADPPYTGDADGH